MTFLMGARACQLCGKSLSRIRVGTDGDFCSREHRNQFRLRQGMDRLMEANTVANLMRRRERPKAIIPNRVDCASSLERHGFLQAPAMPVRPGIMPKAVRRSIGNLGSLGQVRRTQTVRLRFHVLGTGEARRSVGAPPRRLRGLFLLPKVRSGGLRGCDRVGAPARTLSVSAQRGVLLRVSGSAGFRPPQLAVRQVQPAFSIKTIRAGFMNSGAQRMARPSAMRTFTEQWSGLRTKSSVVAPGVSFERPWSGLRPHFREIDGSAAHAIAPGPVTVRPAQVRFELQDSMRYAIGSEEDKG
jgi:hypothetical protein